MKTQHLLLTGVIAIGLLTAGHAHASISVAYAPSPAVAGITMLEVLWDGGGTTDWTSAGMLVELTNGSFYNELAAGSPQDVGNPGFWGFVPSLEYETWVGPAGDASIAGGCGDCGGAPNANFDGPLNVSWFNTSDGDTGLVKIANVALTNDAQGTWTIVSGGETYSGMIPEPASFALIALAGTALLRRRSI